MIRRLARLLNLLIIGVLILAACSSEKSINEYLNDGRTHLENGELSKAIASLEEVLKRDPGLSEAHRLMGEALARSERWPESVTQFEAYQALANEDAAAYYWLGRAYVQTGDLKKAAATFGEGARIDPSFLESHSEEIAEAADDILKAGKSALDTNDLETATDLLTIVAPLVPGEGDIFILLGQAHQQANNLSQALQAFANALELSPELGLEYSNEIEELAQEGMETGQAAFDRGDLATAVEIVQSVTTVRPDDPKAHFLLGNIYNQANDYASAIQEYQNVLRLEPDSSSAHTNIGVVHYKMGDLQAAVQEYQLALDLEPDDAETHYLLGAAYVQMEQLELGKREFETALELNDQFAPPYIGLGNIYLLQSQVEMALEMAQKSIALSPNSPESFFLLGQVNIQMGNLSEARAALEKVLTLNPAQHWREQVQTMLESLDSE
jgi:tetratricopeptide (TPR) repeat protein